ncbi:hypothetical protein [Nocardioides sp.]|uniref:hypothetical protein n=1 Tax=Nocardioides sp. TaxID=35761 RepID=UPI003514F5F8
MRIARRRGHDTDRPEPGTAPAPVDPRVPPPGRVVAEFAGILDGRSLWVAVTARPGRLALRPVGGDQPHALPDHGTDDQPGWLGARLDLTALPPVTEDGGPAVHEVVLLPPGGAAAQPLWTPPLREHRPPPAVRAGAQFLLRRAEDGTLRVRQVPWTPGPTLARVAGGRESLTLVVAGAVPAGAHHLALVDDAGEIARVPLADGVAQLDVATLDALDAATVADRTARVIVLAPDGAAHVMRHANDLGDARVGAPLPTLFDPVTGAPRVRLRWGPGGGLLARLPELAAGAEGAEA